MKKIRKRKDLSEYFQSCLVKSSENKNNALEEEEPPAKSLKSYIIESNKSLEKISLKNFDVEIEDTEDSTLKIISVLSRDKNKKARFFADLLDKRFFIFHTVDDPQFTDNFINSLINQKTSYYDYPWFFNEFMNEVSKLGHNESFTVKFRNEFLKDKEDVLDIGRFSMRFWGKDGRKRLDEIKEKTSLRAGTTLSNVGIKIGDDDSFIKENVTFTGKFTAVQGNSINEHFFILNRLKTLYSKIIDNIESHSISYEVKENKISILGEPIVIKFNKKIDDLEFFIKVLISSKNPFRLWGLPEFIEEDYVSVSGLDLHTGDKIDFEATPNWLRIYLPKGSCGNIITRLLTNIQHYFDSQAELIINGQRIQ